MDLENYVTKNTGSYGQTFVIHVKSLYSFFSLEMANLFEHIYSHH